MASEYYKKKFQDVQKDKPYEMTKEEAWQNWWDYHWKQVLLCAALAVFVIVTAVSFFTRERPDYKVAFVAVENLPMEYESLEYELEQLGSDLNGDGKIIVSIRPYLVGIDTAINDQTDVAGLFGDIGCGNSTMFILDDPAWFMEQFGIIDPGFAISWNSCPALSHIDIGGDYTLALRNNKDLKEDYVADPSLWLAMTAGAE